MKRISRKDFETYERIKQFMIEHKFSEEDLKKYVKREVHLEVSSKGMEPTKFESSDDAAHFTWVSKQTLAYSHKYKIPFITRRKGGDKVFFTEWLEDCQTSKYLSQLDKY